MVSWDFDNWVLVYWYNNYNLTNILLLVIAFLFWYKSFPQINHSEYSLKVGQRSFVLIVISFHITIIWLGSIPILFQGQESRHSLEIGNRANQIMSVSGSKCLQFQFLDPESNLQYNKKEKYLAFTKPRPPWRIGTLKYLEIKIKKWPNRVRRG